MADRKTVVLNPQAKEYYDRLLIVTTNYAMLVKRHRRLRIIAWVTTMTAIVLSLLLLKENVGQVLSWLQA